MLLAMFSLLALTCRPLRLKKCAPHSHASKASLKSKFSVTSVVLQSAIALAIGISKPKDFNIVLLEQNK